MAPVGGESRTGGPDHLPQGVPRGVPARSEPPINDDGPARADAVRTLRRLILAAEHYRSTVSSLIGLGTTESQAVSYLAAHGACGQSELARGLKLTSSASTALVDRLERQGVAERTPHPRDRRRTTVRLTDRGRQIAGESHRVLSQCLEQLGADQLDAFTQGLALVADNLDVVALAIAAGDTDPIPTHALPAA